MRAELVFRILADAVLLLHAGFVLFVVLGLIGIVVGGVRGWRWVRGRWFRGVHLAAIAVVVLQAWLGVLCPLTQLEVYLRSRAADAVYAGGFVAHWVHALLFYEAPGWVFVVLYTAFAAAVVASWLVFPPHARPGDRR